MIERKNRILARQVEKFFTRGFLSLVVFQGREKKNDGISSKQKENRKRSDTTVKSDGALSSGSLQGRETHITLSPRERRIKRLFFSCPASPSAQHQRERKMKKKNEPRKREWRSFAIMTNFTAFEPFPLSKFQTHYHEYSECLWRRSLSYILSSALCVAFSKISAKNHSHPWR